MDFKEKVKNHKAGCNEIEIPVNIKKILESTKRCEDIEFDWDTAGPGWDTSAPQEKSRQKNC